jgi:hypothetical protein
MILADRRQPDQVMLLPAAPQDWLPMIEAVKNNQGSLPALGLADAGYRSESKLRDAPIDLVVALGREGKQHAQIDAARLPHTAAMAVKMQTAAGRTAYRKRKRIAEPPRLLAAAVRRSGLELDDEDVAALILGAHSRSAVHDLAEQASGLAAESQILVQDHRLAAIEGEIGDQREPALTVLGGQRDLDRRRGVVPRLVHFHQPLLERAAVVEPQAFGSFQQFAQLGVVPIHVHQAAGGSRGTLVAHGFGVSLGTRRSPGSPVITAPASFAGQPVAHK